MTATPPYAAPPSPPPGPLARADLPPAEPRYSEGSATQQSGRSRQQPTSVGGGEDRLRQIEDDQLVRHLPGARLERTAGEVDIAAVGRCPRCVPTGRHRRQRARHMLALTSKPSFSLNVRSCGGNSPPSTMM